MSLTISNYKNISNVYLIDTWIAWPIISIFWWIHWNEISWIKANKYFFEQIKAWEINIKKGKIILVLKANEEAVKINNRQVKYNLNRLFKDDWIEKDDYEYKRALELKSILRESDYLLDLHSTSWTSIPFLYSEMHNYDLAKKMWVSHVIWWWWELDWNTVSWDTENYINSHAWVWFTFEAWDHLSKIWFKSAYSMILNFLSVLEIIDKNYFSKIWFGENYMKVIDYYVAKSNDFNYNISIENFQKINAWTLIWIDWWIEVRSKNNMVFIMPKAEDIIEKDVEVYFIGEEI